MATVTDLMAFLRERLDEDETTARAALDYGEWGDFAEDLSDREATHHVRRWDPGAVLVEVAAKRAILDLHETPEDSPGELRHGHWEGYGSNERWIRDEPNECPTCRDSDEPCLTVRLLAQPYHQHPDFDPTWRATLNQEA